MKTSIEKAELYTRTSLIEPNIHDLWNITDSSFHVYSFFLLLHLLSISFNEWHDQNFFVRFEFECVCNQTNRGK